MDRGNYRGFGAADGALRQKPVDQSNAARQDHDIRYIEMITVFVMNGRSGMLS